MVAVLAVAGGWLPFLLLAGILVLDFAISIWNAYSSGFVLTSTRNDQGQRLTRASAWAALGLAFVGMTYVLVMVLSIALYAFGQIDLATATFLASFEFLVFIPVIIGLGVIVTVQSYVIAYKRRDWVSVGVSAWNTFALIYDTAVYAEGFKAAAGGLKGGNKVNIGTIIFVAATVSIFIVWAAYKLGAQKARSLEAPLPSRRSHHYGYGGSSPWS